MATVTQHIESTSDDLCLVAAVRAGDDLAFEQLYVRYESRISAYVRRMVRDHGRAEDITQEVFISALRRMRETDREIVFKPWIYEIAKNACIDAFRRSRNTHEVSFDAEDALEPGDYGRLASPGSAPEVLVDTKLALDDLCGAFGGLSQTHHDILVMREFEGLSYREIGDRLGMSRAAVESTLFRARRRLGEEYEELVSGKRCVRVRGIVDESPGRAVGLRDQRRMARHISHCQPCRRYACLAGIDLEAVRPPVAARIAALLPLPAVLRRRIEGDGAGSMLGTDVARAQNWSSNVVTMLDPAMVSGWSKAVAAAATVAVAGLGAGAAVGDRARIADLGPQPAGILGLAQDRAADGATGSVRSLPPAVSELRGAAQGGAKAGGARRPGAGTGATSDSRGGGKTSVAPRVPGAAAPSTGAVPDGSAVDDLVTGLGVTRPETPASKLGVARDPAAPDVAGERRRPVKNLLKRDGGGSRPVDRRPAPPTVLDRLTPGAGTADVPSGAGSAGVTVGAGGTSAGGGGAAGAVQATPEAPATPSAKDAGGIPKVVGGVLEAVSIVAR